MRHHSDRSRQAAKTLGNKPSTPPTQLPSAPVSMSAAAHSSRKGVGSSPSTLTYHWTLQICYTSWHVIFPFDQDMLKCLHTSISYLQRVPTTFGPHIISPSRDPAPIWFCLEIMNISPPCYPIFHDFPFFSPDFSWVSPTPFFATATLIRLGPSTPDLPPGGPSASTRDTHRPGLSPAPPAFNLQPAWGWWRSIDPEGSGSFRES